MPKKWTGDLVGLMHNYRITVQMLADELGVTNRYVSMVLNGHREPAGAAQKFKDAVESIIKRRQQSTDTPTSYKWLNDGCNRYVTQRKISASNGCICQILLV